MNNCKTCATNCTGRSKDRLVECIDYTALPPVRSEPLLDVAKRLRDAWSMIDNAIDGLAMRGEKDSPLVCDLRAAQEEVETSRQAIYAHTSNAAGEVRRDAVTSTGLLADESKGE